MQKCPSNWPPTNQPDVKVSWSFSMNFCHPVRVAVATETTVMIVYGTIGHKCLLTRELYSLYIDFISINSYKDCFAELYTTVNLIFIKLLKKVHLNGLNPFT